MNDPLDDILDDLSVDELDQDILASYDNIDVDDTSNKVNSSATEFINAILLSVAENSGIDLNDNSSLESRIIKAHGLLELDSLTNHVTNIRYMQHLIKTKMKAIDAGGHMDDSHMEMVIKLTKHQADLTAQKSIYTRNLEQSLKAKADELQASKIQEIENIKSDNSIDVNGDFDYGDDGEDTYKLSQPITGMRELMMQIAKSKNEVVESEDNDE